MKDYKNNKGGRSYGGGNRGSDRNRDYSETHKTTCSECGGVAEVPFKPTGEKSVSCSDCFRKKRGTDDRRPGRDDRGRGRGFGNDRKGAPSVDLSAITKRIDLLHKKIDQIIKALDIKEPFETKDIFRAPQEDAKPKIPKRAPAEEGALKKAVEKILPKDTGE